ncbi:hypothetical protein SERLADRAFT_474852 [Serpula lacrymans var. lacrymans S7.9]|uniref:Uncharacterized protein n=1 Tax=Serpula lacrymans var. lacrymans (strain S7.9) TaxID=578457 RepID=F8P5H5_SERL9|nr:uncharacterized protein SERLADRAFT_474852 [Serpula lacrymans var. lacrymans S7.9]EGO21862.1 hypothetical protein SERLADRAFT_474852 [Serpula lacrymans var. lacrymans S7.9]
MDHHCQIVTQRRPQTATSSLEHRRARRRCSSEQDDLVVRVRLDKLVALHLDSRGKGIGRGGKGGGECALDIVQIDEQTVHLNVPRTPAFDHNGTVFHQLSDIVRPEQPLFLLPHPEHVCRSFLVAKIRSGRLRSHEAYNTGGAGSILGDDAVGSGVEEDKGRTALGGAERDGRWHRIRWSNEHL